MATIETLGEIRGKYNFWNEKERPYYEALSEAIRILNAQNDKCHYTKIVRCGECKHHELSGGSHMCRQLGMLSVDPDWFCADGERKAQE